MANLQDVLTPGERILYTTRRHLLPVIGLILAKIILIAMMTMAGLISFEAFRETQERFLGIFTANELILFGGGMISLILSWSIVGDYVRWFAEVYLLTDRRLVLTSGILNKTIIDEIPLGHISRVKIHYSLPGRLVGYATLLIESEKEHTLSTLTYIGRPEEGKQRILEAIQSYQYGYQYLPEDLAYSPTPPGNGQVTIHRSLERSLEELVALRDRGILSPAEFEAKRQELLSRMPQP